MTTDPFTDAARAEAEGKFPPPRESAVIYPLSAVRSHSRGAFLAGAEWARTHLGQEPIDDEVEAACAGFYNDPSGLTDWTKLARVEPVLADRYRAGMRRALAAARAARRDEEKR